MKAIEIKDLTFSFSNLKLFHNLCLSIEPGKLAAILGPSGCGKSTLFKILAGLLPIKTGFVSVFDRVGEGAKSQTTYLMQEEIFLPWKTLLGNLVFACELAKRDKIEAIRALEDVGLGEFASFYPREISGGMLQKLSLARALLFERPLLLLDEPFGAIDPISRTELILLLKRLQKKHKLSILLITHDWKEAGNFADELYYLENHTITKVANA